MLNGFWSELLLLIRWHKTIHVDVDPRHLPVMVGPLAGWPAAESAVWDLRGQHRDADGTGMGDDQHITVAALAGAINKTNKRQKQNTVATQTQHAKQQTKHTTGVDQRSEVGAKVYCGA